jgi:GH35 family endo-1,4-beta-xylanase
MKRIRAAALALAAFFAIEPGARAVDPLSFPGCRIWLDAQDSTTLIQNAGRLERWENKAAPTNSAEQGTAASRPVVDGTGVNALSSVYFDGSSRSLVFQQNIRATPGEYHCFVVARGVGSGQTFQQIVGSYSGSGTNFTAPNWFLAGPRNADGTAVAFAPQVISVTGSGHVLQSMTIGRAANAAINHFAGWVAEVIVYDRILYDSEADAIRDYLIERWALPPFNPLQVSGCRLWLDAQDAATLTLDAGKVTRWQNKAATGTDAVQATVARQPNYESTGADGTRPGVFFDGNDDWLALEQNIRATAGGFQAFVVASSVGTGTNFQKVLGSYSGSGSNFVAPNWDMNAPHLSGAPVASPLDVFYANGSAHVLQNMTVGRAANALVNHLRGRIAEVIVYDRQLTTLEVDGVVDYLTKRWGFVGVFQPPVGVRIEPELRRMGDALGLSIGAATRTNFFVPPGEASYDATAARVFNSITPANQLKWDAVHPAQATFSFTGSDGHAAFAQASGMAMHGHTLVWHAALPSWLTAGSWTRQQLIDIMHGHIDSVAGRYAGRITVWDVINEPFNSDGTFRATLWNAGIDSGNASTVQRDYFDLAFTRARVADPAAKLIINDFTNETVSAKSTAMLAVLQDMRARGIPADGIGFQMHLGGSIDYTSFAQNMQRFASAGLEVHLTEFDVRVSRPLTTAKDMAQAEVYRQVMRRVLQQPAVKSVTLWGFTDKYSYVPTENPGFGHALIFDEYYQPKRAYAALQEEMMARMTPVHWQRYYFGAAYAEPAAALDADADNDGLRTLAEIALDLDPTRPDCAAHPAMIPAGFAFTPRKLTPQIQLAIETCTELGNWVTVATRFAGAQNWTLASPFVALNSDPASGRVTVSYDDPSPQRFFRLKSSVSP